MHVQSARKRFIVCDPRHHTRSLVAGVLSHFSPTVHFAACGSELLDATLMFAPDLVVTTSRIPHVSGLEFARLVRSGHQGVDRELGIIVMSHTATSKLLAAARDSGVDEVLVCPFTGAALLGKVNAAMQRRRPFVESTDYVGPSRRRRDVNGRQVSRRLTDATDGEHHAPWKTEHYRNFTQFHANVLAELRVELSTRDRTAVRKMLDTSKTLANIAGSCSDQSLRDAANSLCRYLEGVGASGQLDSDAINVHVDALVRMSALGFGDDVERQRLSQGLSVVVDQRLARVVRLTSSRR